MQLGKWSLKKLFTVLELTVSVCVLACVFLIQLDFASTKRFTLSTMERYDHLYSVFEYNDAFVSLAQEYLFATEDTRAAIRGRYNTALELFSQDLAVLMENTELQSTKIYFEGLGNMFDYCQQSIAELMTAIDNNDKTYAYDLISEVSHRRDLINDVMLRYYIRYSSDVSHYVQNGLSEYAALQEVQLAICIAVLGAILAALSCLLRISQKNIAILMRCTKHIVASDYEYVRQQNFSSESDWGRLGIAIQHMSDRIDHYLEEIQEKNRLSMEIASLENERLRMYHCAREAQFKALYNQMSPHFIYNTLNSALQLAYDEKAENTVKLMRAIIEFMRYYTRSAASIIDLESEVQFVQNYIYISKMRYGQRIDFSICKHQDVPNIKLPAVTIQPLVENAIIHGLKECTEQGNVLVEIMRAEDAVIISVEDNGKGIDYDKLEEVMSAGEENRHIGLRNVRDRLLFFFGDQATLTIESQPECGTVITLRLPLERTAVGGA